MVRFVIFLGVFLAWTHLQPSKRCCKAFLQQQGGIGRKMHRNCNGFFPSCSGSVQGIAPLRAASRSVDEAPSDPSPPTEIPGRRTSPSFLSFLFDDSLKLLDPTTMGSYQYNQAKKFGSPIFKTNIFLQPTVVVTNKKYFDLATLEEAKNPGSMVPSFPPHHQMLFGPQSLLVQSGATHSRLRRLIQPSMSPTVVDSFEPLLNESIYDFIQSLKEQSTGGVANDDEGSGIITVVPKIRPFFISISLQVLLGTRMDDKEELNKLADDINIWSCGLLAPPLTFIPWSTAGRAMRARKRVADRMEILIERERSILRDGASKVGGADGKKIEGLLRKLVLCTDDNGDTLSNDDIIDNVLTILFAGSDTTASAATSLWMALSLYPKVKDAVKKNPSKMDGLVRSVLSLYPPAPFAMRKVLMDIDLGEYVVPKNWQLVYGFYGVAEAGSLNEGNLEEWLLQAVSSSSTASPQPSSPTASSASSQSFGGGPRMCPGRYLATRELLAFGKALLDVDWILDPSDQILDQKYTPGYFPVDGLSVKFM